MSQRFESMPKNIEIDSALVEKIKQELGNDIASEINSWKQQTFTALRDGLKEHLDNLNEREIAMQNKIDEYGVILTNFIEKQEGTPKEKPVAVNPKLKDIYALCHAHGFYVNENEWNAGEQVCPSCGNQLSVLSGKMALEILEPAEGPEGLFAWCKEDGQIATYREYMAGGERTCSECKKELSLLPENRRQKALALADWLAKNPRR